MKLFNTLSAVAVVNAQFNDFANLNDLFASLTADLAPSAPVAPAANSDPQTTSEDVADVSLNNFHITGDTTNTVDT